MTISIFYGIRVITFLFLILLFAFTDTRNFRGNNFLYLMLTTLCFTPHITRSFYYYDLTQIMIYLFLLLLTLLPSILQLVQKSFARLMFNDFLRNARFYSSYAVLLKFSGMTLLDSVIDLCSYLAALWMRLRRKSWHHFQAYLAMKATKAEI